MSEYERHGLSTVRPYLIVGDANAAIRFYARAFDAVELERHTTPAGGVGHAKLRIGDAIVELGEHSSARDRAHETLPAIGLRLYVTDTDQAFQRALDAGGQGDPPADRPDQGSRTATIYDPYGLTWWIATPLHSASAPS